MIDNTQKFSGKAHIYSIARPGYPDSLIDYIIENAAINSNSVIADIASGTGKLSESLLKLKCSVFCVEPNADMRHQAEVSLSKFTNFISINGTAENTGLDENSIDLVTAAQAFHWFDAQSFKKECKRILKKDGKVCLIWNSPINQSCITQEIAIICKKFCPQFKGFHSGADNIESLIHNFFIGEYQINHFRTDLLYDRNMFINRMLSSSYSLNPADDQYQNYISALNMIFERYSRENVLTMPNETICYIGYV